MPRVPRRRPRGTGTVYRKGRLWSVSCMESGGRRYAHSFTSKDQAGRTQSAISSPMPSTRAAFAAPWTK